ncbi:MAG TPA: hypothetical protein VER33_24005, partial [Polyangiaceae bacterium]|nr:hypothetical protein [Polyangiaceae bacterium]
MTGLALAFSRAVIVLAVCTGACSDARLDAFSSVNALPEAGAGGSATSGGRSAGGAAGKAGSSGTAGSSGAAQGGTGTTGGTFGGSGAGSGGSSGESNGGNVGLGSELLDDFEDGNNRSLDRRGWWYPSGVPRTAEMSFAPAPGGTIALRAVSTEESEWSFIGLEVVTRMDYDTTRFSALRFRARAEPGSATELRVKLLSSDGDVWSTVELTSSWQQYTLPIDLFAALPGSDDVLNE